MKHQVSLNHRSESAQSQRTSSQIVIPALLRQGFGGQAGLPSVALAKDGIQAFNISSSHSGSPTKTFGDDGFLETPPVISQNRFRPRLPDFLKQEIPHGPAFRNTQDSIQKYHLATVCEEAKCPNRTHCYARGTLAFQILGRICTRSCGFCAEKFGAPLAADPLEPARVVEAARKLKSKHVVITSPARDDMADQGAGQFALVIRQFHAELPDVTVEVLTPDFQAQSECLDLVFAAKPDIFNHNIETVRRLTPKVRSKATYDRTLRVLSAARTAGLLTKSGFMVGHGEEHQELLETMRDLIGAGVQMLTIGQYLPPSSHHLPLVKVYSPQEFNDLKREALSMGFKDVASAPLVRSSFHADVGAVALRSKMNQGQST